MGTNLLTAARRLRASGWYVAVPVLLLASTLVPALTLGDTVDPSTESGTGLRGWAIAAVVVGMAGFIVLGLDADAIHKRKRYASGDHRARVQRLTEALKEAVDAIGAINAEIEDGRRTLEELREQTETTRALATLTEQDIAALRKVLGAGTRISVVWTVAVGAVGIIVGVLLSR